MSRWGLCVANQARRLTARERRKTQNITAGTKGRQVSMGCCCCCWWWCWWWRWCRDFVCGPDEETAKNPVATCFASRHETIAHFVHDPPVRKQKADGAATDPGDAWGSIAPYAASLEGLPDIPLFCSDPKDGEDWRSFKGMKKRNGGQMGIPQGIVEYKRKVVGLPAAAAALEV